MTFAIYSYDERHNYTGLVRRDDEVTARWYGLEESRRPGQRTHRYVIHRFDYDTNGWVFVASFRDGLETSDRHATVSVKPGQVWRSRDGGSRLKVGRVEGERIFGSNPDGSRPRSVALKRLLHDGKHGYELEAGV